jgi:PTH1 family peptidyl-tRNA hydrolase
MLQIHKQEDLALIVVHDELEASLGQVRSRSWMSSARGHNGLKSIRASLKHTEYANPLTNWQRIAIGIGRPEERDPGSVARYVLRPMTTQQKVILGGQVARLVVDKLVELEACIGRQSSSSTGMD